jgi:hypothetical protein
MENVVDAYVDEATALINYNGMEENAKNAACHSDSEDGGRSGKTVA